MVINQSKVGMKTTTVKRATFEKSNQTIMKGLSNKQAQLSEQKTKLTFEQTLIDDNKDIMKKNDNSKGNTLKGTEKKTEKENEVIDYYKPGSFVVPMDVNSKRNGVRDFLNQLRDYMIDMRRRMLEFLGVSSVRLPSDGESGEIYLTTSQYGTKWRRISTEKVTVTEYEKMEFETEGKVVTADGRELTFNLSIEMTREFVEASECISDEIVTIFTDPLVISLNSNPIAVSDEKWSFDIDGDGKKDNVSLLSKGSGFLVYDKNENGIIDNGTEMFGARTGNGFSELAAYDDDANGWIDENDEIYSKLSVWIKDDSGDDRLISLKEADVGAIYLDSSRTDYSLKSDKTNEYNALLKRNGVYITEGGLAKTVAQLDMAKRLVSELSS